MRERVFCGLAGMCLAALLVPGMASALDFSVTDCGRLLLSEDHQIVFSGVRLHLESAGGVEISSPLKTPVRCTMKDGVSHCEWGTDRGTVSRTVRKLKNGKLEIVWAAKMLNGIPNGGKMCWTYNLSRPEDLNLTFSVRGEPPVLVYRTGTWLNLVQNYDPARVNEYKIMIQVGWNKTL